MARVFLRFDGDDLLHVLERQGWRPFETLSLAQHRRLEERFAQAVAGSTIREVLGDLARDAARQMGPGPAGDAGEDPDGGSGAPLSLCPGDVAARDAF